MVLADRCIRWPRLAARRGRGPPCKSLAAWASASASCRTAGSRGLPPPRNPRRRSVAPARIDATARGGTTPPPRPGKPLSGNPRASFFLGATSNRPIRRPPRHPAASRAGTQLGPSSRRFLRAHDRGGAGVPFDFHRWAVRADLTRRIGRRRGRVCVPVERSLPASGSTATDDAGPDMVRSRVSSTRSPRVCCKRLWRKRVIGTTR